MAPPPDSLQADCMDTLWSNRHLANTTEVPSFAGTLLQHPAQPKHNASSLRAPSPSHLHPESSRLVMALALLPSKSAQCYFFYVSLSLVGYFRIPNVVLTNAAGSASRVCDISAGHSKDGTNFVNFAQVT